MSWQAFIDLFQTGALLMLALVIAGEIRARRAHTVNIAFDVRPKGSTSAEELARAAEGAAAGFTASIDDDWRRVGR